ncbi:hypothetical protein BDV97DRAFT_42366 [Delphinella strobiligena]|nr:hypothetical protein BDV97DRAFT_42366 [Delphinella strobiligena]
MHPFPLLPLALLASLLATTTALTITSPTNSTILTPANFTITWTNTPASDLSTNHTSASQISINLINDDLSGEGAGYAPIGSNISASKNIYTVPAEMIEGLGYVSDGSGWVVVVNEFAAGNAFLAESSRFTLAGVGGSGNGTAGASASTSALSSSGSGTAGLAGITSITGTSTSTASGAGSGGASSASGSASAAASTSSGIGAAATAKISFAARGVLGAAALAILQVG